MKRTIVRAMGWVLVCLVGIATANGQAAQQQRPQLAEEVFKNVQIIKGIPVDEFMDTMGMFAAATNMNCVDCHTSDSTESWENFAKETPLKQTARRMLLMVDAINKNLITRMEAVRLEKVRNGRARSDDEAQISNVEVESALELAKELEYIDAAEYARLDAIATETAKTLWGLLRKVGDTATRHPTP